MTTSPNVSEYVPLTHLEQNAIISMVTLQGIAVFQGAFDASLLFASCMLCTVDLPDGQSDETRL